MTGLLNSSRGSIWRRWDLHIHTPFSALNNGFGSDFEQYAATLLKSAVAQDIAVIGVTDYFSIEGYKRLRELLANPAKLQDLVGQEIASQAARIALFPNIEFRTREIVRGADGKDSRVNFHVIFDPELEPGTIEDHFLHRLYFTAQSSPGGRDDERALTIPSLRDLGAALKTQHDPFSDRSDLVVGMNQAVVGHEAITEQLQKAASLFDRRYLILVPADEDLSNVQWNGQGHLIRKLLLQKSHMLFSSNAKTRAFGLGELHSSRAAFVAEFKSLKPCVHGSDAHRSEELFRPSCGRQLWVKSDPTFSGLRQVLHEPEDRCYIGDEPPALERARKGSTRVIDQIDFAREPNARTKDVWFRGSVPLNPGLVAVIGRKGSGKSALADVLGLIGNSYARGDFTFLNTGRFLKRRTGLGQQFRATARWLNGDRTGGTLDLAANLDSPERVQYLPQARLEAICDQDAAGDGPTQFDAELAGVIFSHVADADRLGHSTLDALIAYQTAEVQRQIETRERRIGELNAAINSLRHQTSAPARAQLLAALAQRRDELRAHVEAEPVVPEQPQSGPGPLDSELAKSLDAAVARIEQLDSKIADSERELAQERKREAAAQRLIDRIENLRDGVEEFYVASASDAAECNHDVRALVKLEINDAELLQSRDTAKLRCVELEQALDGTLQNSLVHGRKSASATARGYREQLDAPNREYQDAVRRHAVWRREREQISGSTEVVGSVVGLEARLAQLEEIPEAIKALESERAEIVASILKSKFGLVATFETLYAPVQRFIASHPVARDTDSLEFAATISIEGLLDGLLSMIHQGRRGPFQGDREGRQRLQELVEAADFSTVDGVQSFCTTLVGALTGDGPDDPTLQSQLKSGYEASDVLDFIYGLSYLVPKFQLRWQGKALEQLSPGERGTL
ncbi:MAG: hypothetical protein PGN13_14095, partial [Patulibacter minatonensis]